MKIWRNDKRVVKVSKSICCQDCALVGEEFDYYFRCLALHCGICNPAKACINGGGGINMKLMFNEIGGQNFNIGMWDCKDCVFCHSKWCNSLRISHPFHRWCGNEVYRATSLDIFYL